MELTQARVKELFEYKNGNLYRKKDHFSEKSGDLVGCIIKNTGYYKVNVFGKSYVLHKIIYLWHTGEMP
jgi:hypothetical protein